MPQYTVHAFVVVRVKVPTEAPSRKAAARAVAEQTDFASLLPCRPDIEYAEEVLGALVDVEGDTDFRSTRYYRYRELRLHSTKKGKGEERANERQDRHSHRKP
jgi:hypothetical protein